MIRFTGEYRRNMFDDADIWNKCSRIEIWMTNRRYLFDDFKEGKAFYDYWNKH